MEPTGSVDFTWNLGNAKFRDGRYGPTFAGRVETTHKLLTVEVLEQSDPQTIQNLISHLSKEHAAPAEPHPYIVTYLGFQQNPEGLCLIWQWEGEGTLQNSIRQYGQLEQEIVRIYVRRIAAGLDALQRRGFETAHLNSANILLTSGLTPKIEPPILDLALAGRAPPPGLATVPELVLDGPVPRNAAKADVWLLGVVAAEALSGACLTADAARGIAAQVREGERDSAWELFMPQGVAKKLDAPTVDFLRQCFMVDPDQRPSAADLLKHPFIGEGGGGQLIP